MGSILFCLPGIYLALVGLGAGGGDASQQHVISTASAITFGLFALSGWFGGSILNLIKPKLMIMLAAGGYPLYISSLWYLDRTGNVWFPYLGGAILGITAGLLWTAAGFIQFAYATDDEKTRFISWQWAMTSFGGTIGSLIAFGINIHATETTTSNALYIIFIVIQVMAILIALCFIVDPKHVIRDDGTHIAIFIKTSFRTELKRQMQLFTDWKVWILIPGIFVAEMNLVCSFFPSPRYLG
jgi:MFS family permease